MRTEKYDKLCVVLVCLPRGLGDAEGALRMLRLLFYNDEPFEDRMRELREDFGIRQQLLEGTMSEMTFGEAMLLHQCNEAKAKGEAEGRAEGRAAGKTEAWTASALALCDAMKMELADALELLRVPAENRPECMVLAAEMRRAG